MDLLTLVISSFPGTIPDNCRVYNLTGSSAALLLALEGRFVAVEMDEARAELLRKDINFYRRLFSGSEVLFLPDPDGPEASGERAGIIHYLKDPDSIVTSSKNLRTKLWDKKFLSRNVLQVRTGEAVTRSAFEASLARLGYARVPMVVDHGEYSRREWIMDVFPPASEHPVRIEFFGDEIERMRSFDIESQRSLRDIQEFALFPVKEPAETVYPVSNLSGELIPAEEQRDIISSGVNLLEIMGERRFFSLSPAHDELPGNTVFLSRYSFDSGGFISEEDIDGEGPVMSAEIDAGILSFKGLGVLPEERRGMAGLPAGVKGLAAKNRVIIVASSEGQSKRIRDVLREDDIIAPVIGTEELMDFSGNISITIGELSSGIYIGGLAILTEKELFGERPAFRSLKKSRVAGLLVSIDDIKPGDFVVHRDYGVGKFAGVVRRRTGDTELELMQLEYEDGRLYLPVEAIRNIAKFRSEEGVAAKTDRLGGKSWQRKKERVRKKVQEMAARLLALYAGRKAARGFSFSAGTELHREFDSFFAYEETPDQLKAIQDIKADMESDTPMDRLLCGDVGYGKTEVAMRAAFKAVYDNRQVAVLVPTTILAEQHHRTFRERFSGFPVNIDFISRFKSRKEIDLALKGVSDGTTDIIIGTHGLLSKKVSFSRLGLLVVDEEHRFGVGQKERIKEMSRSIDVLNLTATPIPRTLHMALSGIRNISVIETPPEERLAVKSIVTVFNDGLIRDAATGEMRRNGQVFFVHNRIHDIYRIGHRIQELVPSARVGVAHGQMPEKELETIMHRFFSGEIDVLVSTAIIGSGIDIPSANTIIINMADRMGLADLYQLRGRVGRSNLKGYAYFLAPPEPLLTEEAKKRLQAVQEMSYLGAGFRLALKDLEIRGAGDIFGPEQSGHINEIGFELYIEMLEKAVAELKGIEIKEEVDPVIDLSTSAFIPEDYISDITLRLSFYRRVASLKSGRAADEFELELRDRFGPLPEEVVNLLDVMRLKILSRELSIVKIHEKKGMVGVLFSPDTKVQPGLIFELQKSRKGKIRFLPDGFELDLRGADWKKVFEEVYKALKELKSNLEALLL